MRKERPEVVKVVRWAAGNGDRSENGDYIYGKKRLREIDRRIRFLSKRLANAEVVDPARRAKTDQVFFGATVTYANGRGRGAHRQDRRHRRGRARQGPCELDLADRQGAAAREEGDVVKLRTPAGVEEIEIVKVEYRLIGRRCRPLRNFRISRNFRRQFFGSAVGFGHSSGLQL